MKFNYEEVCKVGTVIKMWHEEGHIDDVQYDAMAEVFTSIYSQFK